MFTNRIRLVLLFLLLAANLPASEWQWSVKLKGYISPETQRSPDAFLWIPENCMQVRAVVVGQHNMCEETIFGHPVFRKTMADLGFGIIWISPGFEQQWNVADGCQQVFDNMLKDLAEASGYSELAHVPIVPLGHSAMATYPWNFAAWNPGRTLAVISFKGDAPRTNLTGYGRENIEWGRTRNLDGIPGLMVMGELEWWEARVNPALAFRMMYPESCISFLCDAGNGHFDVSDEVVDYISLFLRKAAAYRLPVNQPLESPAVLKKTDVRQGWLSGRWQPAQESRAAAAPFEEYKGDSHDAFWYFDREMAEATEEYYRRVRGKQQQYIGFAHQGALLPFRKGHDSYDLRLSDLEVAGDGLTFSVSGAFTDSLHQETSALHARENRFTITRICGPAKQLNDTTFTIRFYRMGTDNPRRTGVIWLMAHHAGDNSYKNTVQQMKIDFPYPYREGKEQQINFPEIKDVRKDVKTIPLKAVSDAGLPVRYYVKEGPAMIDEKSNRIVITGIPPRASYPVKVTVVAWQYGKTNEPQVQSAKPVERVFYINR